MRWSRLLLPAVVVAELLPRLLGFQNHAWHWMILATALLLELALVGLVVYRFIGLKPEPGVLPEDHLARPLLAFVPAVAARMIALELVVMMSAFRFLFGGWRHPDPPGFTYTRDSVLGAILPALPLLILGDLVLLEVFLRGVQPWIRLGVHFLDAYGILWVMGLWSTFRSRPHTLDAEFLHLHKGLLGSLDLRRDHIEAIDMLPNFDDDWARFRFMRTVLRFHTPGPQQLLLKLKEPVRAQGFFGMSKARSSILIALDEPQALRTALGA